MKMFRHGGYVIGAVLLMLGIGMLICYTLFARRSDISMDGTLVNNTPAGVRSDCFLDASGRQVCA